MDKIILVASCVAAVIADTLLVFYAKTKAHTPALLIAGIVLTNIAAVVWAYSMRKGIESSLAITFYALFTVVACAIVGVFVFHEHLSPLNIVGMVLALVALVLIGV